MHSVFHIDAASNEDIPTIKEIVFTVLREYGLQPDEKLKDKDLDDIEKNYFESHGFFGLATNSNSGKIVGTFGLARISDTTCELRKMYLVQSERGKGIGKLMLENAIDIARKKGYHTIMLETIAPLKEAIALYQKYHFKEIKPAEVNQRVDRAFSLDIREKRDYSSK